MMGLGTSGIYIYIFTLNYGNFGLPSSNSRCVPQMPPSTFDLSNVVVFFVVVLVLVLVLVAVAAAVPKMHDSQSTTFGSRSFNNMIICNA